MIRCAAAVVALLVVTAGCGTGTTGRATIWITRDRGAHVLKVTRVPAGLTAMQALERVAHVSTRYAGRYVESIDGVRGSLTTQHDWFYFVNGYEADRSAAEYRLHAGDVEWWDFRAWRNAMHVPVVVGAFPEPFLHGWDGRRREAVVEYDGTTRRRAQSVARRLHARVAPLGSAVPSDANVLVLECPHRSAARVTARMRAADRVGAPVVFTVVCEPSFAQRMRFRYEVTS